MTRLTGQVASLVQQLAELGPVLVVEEYRGTKDMRLGPDKRLLRSGDTLGVLVGRCDHDDLETASLALGGRFQPLLEAHERMEGHALHFGIRRGAGLVLVS